LRWTPIRQRASAPLLACLKLLHKLVPISEMAELIKERTGGEGSLWHLLPAEPEVDDIPERYTRGTPRNTPASLGLDRPGRNGCICPRAPVKALVTHLFLRSNDLLIVDMDAGLEHLAGLRPER